MRERWAHIKGHPDYEVSTKGRIRKTLRPIIDSNTGRHRINLGIPGACFYIGRIVAETFIPKEEGDMYQIVYLNGDNTDDRLENIRWKNAKIKPKKEKKDMIDEQLEKYLNQQDLITGDDTEQDGVHSLHTVADNDCHRDTDDSRNVVGAFGMGRRYQITGDDVEV